MQEVLSGAAEPGVLEYVYAEEALLDGAADTGVDDAAGAADAGSDAGDAGAGGDDTDLGDGGAGGDDDLDLGTTLGDDEPLTGAKLWNASKEALKEIDPKLRAAINKEIHKADSITKAFPEGVDKAKAVIQSISQLANVEGDPAEKAIAETLSERKYFRELDQAYTDASPAFAEKLVTAKPEAFDAIAPMIFNKYAETNPDGFAGFVSRTVLQHMDAADVPLNFKVLQTFLPQLADGPAKDRVIEAIEAIYGWQSSLRTLAAKKVEPKTAKPGEGGGKEAQATKEQEIADREEKVTLKEWNTETLQPGIRMVYAEADKCAGKQKLTGEERKSVLAKVGEELDARLAGNKGYGDAMRGYLKAGNKAAFQQRLDAERKKLIPGAARRAVDDVIAERKSKAAAAAAAGNKDGKAKPGTKPAAGAAAAADAGEKVEWIAGSPTTQGLVVDLNRTSHAMLMKKRAFIKGKTTTVAWK